MSTLSWLAVPAGAMAGLAVHHYRRQLGALLQRLGLPRRGFAVALDAALLRSAPWYGQKDIRRVQVGTPLEGDAELRADWYGKVGVSADAARKAFEALKTAAQEPDRARLAPDDMFAEPITPKILDSQMDILRRGLLSRPDAPWSSKHVPLVLDVDGFLKDERKMQRLSDELAVPASAVGKSFSPVGILSRDERVYSTAIRRAAEHLSARATIGADTMGILETLEADTERAIEGAWPMLKTAGIATAHAAGNVIENVLQYNAGSGGMAELKKARAWLDKLIDNEQTTVIRTAVQGRSNHAGLLGELENGLNDVVNAVLGKAVAPAAGTPLADSLQDFGKAAGDGADKGL